MLPLTWVTSWLPSGEKLKLPPPGHLVQHRPGARVENLDDAVGAVDAAVGEPAAVRRPGGVQRPTWLRGQLGRRGGPVHRRHPELGSGPRGGPTSPSGFIEAVVERWDSHSDIARYGVASLVHGLLARVVGGQFAAVQPLDDEIEQLEDSLFLASGDQEAVQPRSFALRKCPVLLRRVVLPMREVVNTLLRREVHLVDDAMGSHFQVVSDTSCAPPVDRETARSGDTACWRRDSTFLPSSTRVDHGDGRWRLRRWTRRRPG